MPVPAICPGLRFCLPDWPLASGFLVTLSASHLWGLHGPVQVCYPAIPPSGNCPTGFRTGFTPGLDTFPVTPSTFPVTPSLQRGPPCCPDPCTCGGPLCRQSFFILLLFKSKGDSRENQHPDDGSNHKIRSLVAALLSPSKPSPQTRPAGLELSLPPSYLCDSAVSFPGALFPGP